MKTAVLMAACVLCALVVGAASGPVCAPSGARAGGERHAPAASFGQELPEAAARRGVALRPRLKASASFLKHWGDGRAEVSGYRIRTPRYGALREGQLALIYVTEDLDRRTWIKDDGGAPVPAAERVAVIKLNHVLKFQTGIYPYSVMTSVFAPVHGVGRERFAPVKITFTGQEWCGQVFQLLKPTADRFYSQLRSYFGSEGDRDATVRTAPFALYEDALLIQLRELDGPFAGGGTWRGQLVPALWSARKQHVPLRPMAATITREDATRAGVPATRFVLKTAAWTRTYDVEKAPPRRVLGWQGSDGERATLIRTERLAYWRLNGPDGERALDKVGLPPPAAAPAGP